MARGTFVTGYAFPNPPENWSPEEKRFALALRGLFDTLFQKTRGLQTDYEKDNYNSLKNKPSIAGQILTGNKSLNDLGIHTVNADDAGMMTPAMLALLMTIDEEVDDLMSDTLITKVNKLTAWLDYLSMMTEIAIPTDTGNKVSRVTYYYDAELWDQTMVYNAVGLWITAEDYEIITGEPYVPPTPDPEPEPDPEE